MTKMDLGTNDTQSSTTSAAMSSRNNAYATTMEMLTAFIGADSLQGNAYTSAKSYASQVLLPLLKAATLYSESLSEGVGKLPTEYRNYPEIGGESPLDSALLEEELNSLDATLSSLNTSLATATAANKDTSAISESISTANTRRTKVVNQLAELASFDAASAGFFDGMTDIESTLATGLEQVQSGMSSFSGTFVLPCDLSWANTATKHWNQRQKLLDRLNKGESVDGDFLEEIKDYIGLDHTMEKEVLVYDNIYGYGIYKIALNVSKDGKVSFSAKDGKVTGVSTGKTDIALKDGKVDGAKLGKGAVEVDSKGNVKKVKGGHSVSGTDENGYVRGFSNSLAVSQYGPVMSHTETIEKDGRKVTITNETGTKTRNGRAAIYQNHTEKSAVDAKIKGIDMTTELTTAYEAGVYGGNIYPTAYATVPVKEFEWDMKVKEVQKVQKAVGSVANAVADVGGFVWDHGGKQLAATTIVVTGTVLAVGLAIETFGVGATASGALALGSLALASKILDDEDGEI